MKEALLEVVSCQGTKVVFSAAPGGLVTIRLEDINGDEHREADVRVDHLVQVVTEWLARGRR